MKAAILSAPDQAMRFEEITLGKLAPREVRLAVKSSSICHSDILYMNGGWEAEYPIVLGHEIAGVVLEMGDDVQNLEKGQHIVATLISSCGSCAQCLNAMPVCCDRPPQAPEGRFQTTAGAPVKQAYNTGGFATETIVDIGQIVAIPDEMPMDHAALLACGVITGWGAVKRVAQVNKGDHLAVIGVGGVGLSAIQAARIAGAETILAIDTNPTKENIARQCGATHFANPLDDDVPALARRLSGGYGLDKTLVAAGSSRAIASSVDLLRKGGRVVIVGMPASNDLLSLDASSLAGDSLSLVFTKMGSSVISEDIPALIRHYMDGALDLEGMISHRFAFDEINTALEVAQSDEALRVVLTMP